MKIIITYILLILTTLSIISCDSKETSDSIIEEITIKAGESAERVKDDIKESITRETKALLEEAKQKGRKELVDFYEKKLLDIQENKMVKDIIIKYPETVKYFEYLL